MKLSKKKNVESKSQRNVLCWSPFFLHFEHIMVTKSLRKRTENKMRISCKYSSYRLGKTKDQKDRRQCHLLRHLPIETPGNSDKMGKSGHEFKIPTDKK